MVGNWAHMSHQQILVSLFLHQTQKATMWDTLRDMGLEQLRAKI